MAKNVSYKICYDETAYWYIIDLPATLMSQQEGNSSFTLQLFLS